MNDYAEKLKDSRWIEKRAKILARDNNRCQVCGTPPKRNNPLHVHHLVYHRQPWDVKDDSLTTLCASCHRREEQIRKVDTCITALSKETKIPALILHDILIDMTVLRMNNINEFRDHVNEFLYKAKKRPYRLSL